MNIVDKARALESRIARALNRAAESAVGAAPRQPLELVHAILDGVTAQIQPGGRGSRLFAFDAVAVTVAAPSRDARAQLEAMFAAPPSLCERIAQKLQLSGCDRADVRVDISYAARPGRNWTDPDFHIAFQRRAAAGSPADTQPIQVELRIVRGSATQPSFETAAARIDLGRGAEVRDNRNRLVRTNQVAFVEGATAENQTVSRQHAHIAVDPSSGSHRLYDDGSVHGTGILRGGRTIPVPPGARGVRLQSDDEIVLGEARLRVRFGGATR